MANSLAKLPPSCPLHMEEGPRPFPELKTFYPVFSSWGLATWAPAQGNLGGNCPECDDDIIPADTITMGNAIRPTGLQPMTKQGKVPGRPFHLRLSLGKTFLKKFWPLDLVHLSPHCHWHPLANVEIGYLKRKSSDFAALPWVLGEPSFWYLSHHFWLINPRGEKSHLTIYFKF